MSDVENDAGSEEVHEVGSRAPTVVASTSKTGAPAQSKGLPSAGLDMKTIIGMHEVQGGGIMRKALGEFTGTFLLVFIACGACFTGFPTRVDVALVFGFTVATIVQSLGHVSGGHLNPAVSFGLIPAGHCGLARAVVYLIAQCLGSTVAAFLLSIAIPKGKQGGLGTTSLQQGLLKDDGTYSFMGGLIIEFIITFVLVLLVCGVLDKLRNKDVKGFAPLAVGLAIASGHFVGAPFTGPSMNPARSFGPALVYAITGTASSTPLEQLWVYFIGPIGGGVVAGFLYRLLFKERESFDNDEALRAEQQQNAAPTSKA